MGILIRWLCFSLVVSSSLAQVRMDCYPESGASQAACEARGCIWKQADQKLDSVEPWCYFAPGIGYTFASQAGNVITLTKNNGPKNPWGTDFPSLSLTTSFLGKTLNVKITSTSGGRYEPSLGIPRQASTSSDSVSLKTNNGGNPFSFEVVRSSTNRRIFDTSLGGLFFSDQFIQIATNLPSENLYGFGENIHQTIKHNFSTYLTWGMFARDEGPDSYGTDTKNLYGTHPFYMMLEPDGKAHGVFILNSNAQEVTTAPGPALIYRTIGGLLDLYFFPGPNPEDVIQQYQALIGKPFLPAYWALGYQLSRWGYQDLAEMQQKISNVRGYGIPLDTAVVDIDYMDRYKDFTIGQQNWAGLPAYVDTMHSWGMKTILIFDPAIQVDYPTFQRGLNQNARFIEWERMDQVMHSIQDQYPLVKDTKIMLGVVWPDHHVAFPDFLDDTGATMNWWMSEFNLFQQQVAFDGIWIDMNEASNFGTNEAHPWYFDNPDHPDDATLSCPNVTGSKDSQYDMPPYQTHNVWIYGAGNTLATKTLCMLAVQGNGTKRYYDVKNLYGWSESYATQQALFSSTRKRGAVISRSTFPSSGRFAGHWLGDNTARWEDLRTSVIGAQEFNLFGIPYVGSDICGFNGATNEELCLRWQQMGAFHSFMRNHNSQGQPPQDPAEWPSVAAATKKANLFRYKYLPYLFTQHHLASANGGTVVKPVFFEFPHDVETYNIGYQFMWGRFIMVAPVLYQGATTVSLYIPDGTFYSLFDYNYGKVFEAGMVTVPAPTTSLIPVFVRAGNIIPRQTPNVTTSATRLNPFEVLIVPDITMNAIGNCRWDDGESIIMGDLAAIKFWDIKYSFSGTSSSANFTVSVSNSDSSVALPSLNIIEIFNYPNQPNFTSFKLNGNKVNVNVQTSSYSAITKILTISTSNLISISTTTQVLIFHLKTIISVPYMEQPIGEK